MSKISPESTVAEIVSEKISRSKVFENNGIDFCCGGDIPLSDICRVQGLKVEKVLQELDANDIEHPESERDWNTAPLHELCDDIVAVHHENLRREMPRIKKMIEKLAEVHKVNHPELRDLLAVFSSFEEEITSHLMKEEHILFPMIKQLETASASPEFHCYTVANPIHVMMSEHESAGEALDKMRTITKDYIPPEDACNTYKAMLDALHELESDTHRHIHRENHILFPRAQSRESELK